MFPDCMPCSVWCLDLLDLPLSAMIGNRFL